MMIIKKHSLSIRWFHWVNFPLLIIMTWSGLLIYWANDIYAISLGPRLLLKFFPQWMYDSFNLGNRLAEGMAFHFAFMWLFLINGTAYVSYTIFSGEWRLLVPNKKTWAEAARGLLNLVRFRKPKLVLMEKYNPAQRIAYSLIVIMGLGSVLTGVAIYKPIQFGWLCSILGGYEAARVIHFILTIGYCLFFLIHVIQVFRAGWNNFQAMVTGYVKMDNQNKDKCKINEK